MSEYKLTNITPKDMQCFGGLGCPAIYQEGGATSPHQPSEDYLIVGRQIDPSSFGLENKVSKGEVLIRVPRRLIDNRSN